MAWLAGQAPLFFAAAFLLPPLSAIAGSADAQLQELLRKAAMISRDQAVVTFSGLITEENVRRLIEELDRAPTRELVIDSPGGVTGDGRDLGREVHRRGLTVRVEARCDSSCANYVFTAAARRIIGPEGLVVWHGNSLQKDFRERRRCGRTHSSFTGAPFPGSSDEYARVRSMAVERDELAFFASIGIDDYIARAGQEPRFHGNFTMTVEDMAKFGVRNVTAPADYGTRDFCRVVNQRRGTDLHCIAVTDQHVAYERARRELGEACQVNGTLRIRTSTALNAHAATVPSRSDR